jgi:GH15 family glucan-1,4-alpha-glucosidase
VRIGNAAVDQEQLDIYGAFLSAVGLYVEHAGRLDRDTAKEIAETADYLCELWRRKDSGIWEVRSAPTHFIQSKVMCWVALDRAVRLAEAGVIPDRNADRWREEAAAIRAFVDEQGWDAERGSYVRATDLRELDASLLTMALLDWPDPERVRGTVEAVRRELGHGPYVYRYKGEDGVEGGEGSFLTCSFWLADALARTGRPAEAAELMDELVGLANDVGLYGEEIDPRDGAFLGNFPQALSHLALINAAVSIEEASEPA